jgi:hypothetical protein
MSTDPDLIAGIRPAVREFDAAVRAGRDSVCLTMEVAGNRRVWVQLLGQQVNVGLYDDEDGRLIQQSLKRHGLQFTGAGCEQGVYVEVHLPGQRDERFVLFLHDVLIRHQRGRPCSLNVKHEDL